MGKSNSLWPILWGIIFGLSLLWRAQNLTVFSTYNDEGAHLMWAKLAVNGHPLYSDTQAVQSPLFLETIGLAFRLAGQTIQAGRGAILSSFVLLAVSLSWLAYRNDGWSSALTALFLLSISPLAFTFSRLVMAEIPATALAVISLALIFPYLDSGRRIWLIASGLALGLSFITKALNPFIIVPIGLLLASKQEFGVQSKASTFLSAFFVITHHARCGFVIRNGYLADLQSASRLQIDSISATDYKSVASVEVGKQLRFFYWSLGLAFPLIAILLIYEPMAIYDQLILFRNDLRVAVPGSFAETAGQFEIFIRSHWGIWLLAIGFWILDFGFWIGRIIQNPKSKIQNGDNPKSKIQKSKIVWLVWLISGMIMLCWHTPLFPHHFIVLLPPLILLASRQVSEFVSMANERKTGLSLFCSGLFIVIAAFNIPAMLKANQQTLAVATGGREQQAIKFLQAVSQPTDFVMGDSQLLIFMADRSTPPPLGDVALVAIKAGRQTSARMIKLTERYRSSAVVQWSLRLPWLPDYLSWVQANYLTRRVWDNDHIIYFVPRWPSGHPLPNEQTVHFGDSLILRGYQLAPQNGGNEGRADQLNLKVYWQTDTPLTKNYTVFTQLLDHNGALVANWDSEPLAGNFPTTQWPPNEIVTDIIQLSLPPNLSPGDYTLITGMYLLESMERLPTSSGMDYVTLVTIKLVF